MSWKKWAAGTFGAAAIVSALAFANVAAASQGSVSTDSPTTTQNSAVVDPSAGSPTMTPEFQQCGGGEGLVAVGLPEGTPQPTQMANRCFATRAEVLAYLDITWDGPVQDR
jgi:hypothetical protein